MKDFKISPEKRTVLFVLRYSLLLLLFFPPRSGFAEQQPVVLLISKEIKPFIEMVTGFEGAIDLPVVRVFLDEKGVPFSHDPRYKGLGLHNYAYIIAVGPSALSYLCTHISKQDMHKFLYAMVLDPEKIIPEGIEICGISLNLFSGAQISKIPKVLPGIKRIGVFFDPANNKAWFSKTREFGKVKGIEFIPLHVQVRSDMNRLYGKGYKGVDALLFIPDRSVISPTIIKHVIKQSLARKIPVIGYNQFFYQSGAAMSFVLNYKGIGLQMAEMVTSLLKGGLCAFISPAHDVMLNRKVLKILDVKINDYEI